MTELTQLQKYLNFFGNFPNILLKDVKGVQYFLFVNWLNLESWLVCTVKALWISITLGLILLS